CTASALDAAAQPTEETVSGIGQMRSMGIFRHGCENEEVGNEQTLCHRAFDSRMVVSCRCRAGRRRAGAAGFPHVRAVPFARAGPKHDGAEPRWTLGPQ